MKNESTEGHIQCGLALQNTALRFLEDDTVLRNFYAGLYYTDVGYPEQCERVTGGKYQQMVLTLTHLPVRIPLSFCLPKQCNDSSYIQPYLNEAAAFANQVLDQVKAKQSLDGLFDLLSTPEVDNLLFKFTGDQDKQLLQQFTSIVNNQSQVVLTQIVKDQDAEQQENDTRVMWSGVKVTLLLIFLVFVLIPNILLFYTHCL